MSALDATRLIDSRFKTIEDRLAELSDDQHEDRTEVAILKHAVDEMTDAFKSFRNALYAAAGSILVAAILVIALGHP